MRADMILGMHVRRKKKHGLCGTKPPSDMVKDAAQCDMDRGRLGHYTPEWYPT